ncbi:hypothetical protein AGABI2DRAFT_221648 [Agaricus bisporus var. bisporus H97]|uniref:hypothetical protein n=1 Tax=Agaricus bisporus var. bisporus (strain H97 / ATCC MYA-4626 / FGSC 10389) TaxID=936046 RepID=UPI00029F7BB0|nr:hypothetical protein AGABI2DRAFT_221648 [Agaricus bisporus var. bisporus H97]EKV47479.1 hypothetical protein AGABI2DRAFT_221648 [Agaricus bisporus var. bisporus H97]
MTVLGTQRFESPTVLAANGYVCIGTSDGKILVYDFRQNLQCVCAVTALALSHDHTCVAAGYSTGYIQIYNLSNSTTPIRSVPPTSLSLVYSGRKEGHIQGSRIVSLGFVGGRHTAVVSADIYGLAFYHSLGKVLFVEAPDILRILGRYPDPSPPQANTREHTVKHRNPRYTILMMAPLPLGTSPHVTDKYNLVAMLTPTKMVVVGLKPSPKTWFKIARGLDEGGAWRSQTTWRGTVAWFPSIFQESNSGNESDEKKEEGQGPPTAPVLAFSWGHSLRVVKIEESEVGAINYQSMLSWTAEEEILAMQWLNSQQLVILTESEMGVFDLRERKLVEQLKFDFSSLMSPSIANTVNGNINYQNSIRDVSHSMRIYKGKIFLLVSEIRVGTLLTWADKILSLVDNGDFLNAIELTRSYYLDEAPGNRNSLPSDLTLRQEIIGDKLRDLMIASTRYAFSDDRMTDSTHVTPDGRGVDRTVLFESLVVTCCHACIALNDTEFLFEELFQKYDDSGILRIYLRHLEPFMLNNEIRFVPPRITQRLISLHEEDGRPDLVERVIWHIDPACLDINQAIHLCQRHNLYDALIYVYTRALRDYVAPIVELLGLIRRVNIHRRERAENRDESEHDVTDSESGIEPMILHSYKIYPYLSHVLSGLTYPSGEPLPEDEAFQAKKDIYTFLFYGRSTVWPPGDDGKLILTSDEEGGAEPTHPYIRQLLQWDSESFLHSLDIAFEDPFLHDETQKSINRLIVVRILLELVNSPDALPSEDAIFLHIFIARNAPKYPHFLFDKLSPTILHNTLLSLAEGGRLETREDRQLAAEYLLSVYKPHDTEDICTLFEAAGFYRILRTWYRRDRRWDLLFMTYLNDSDIQSPAVFERLDEVLAAGAQSNKGVLSTQLAVTLEDSLGRLLELGEAETALLVQTYDPQLHRRALDVLGGSDADDKRLLYLHALFSTLKPGSTSTPPSEPLSAMLSDLGHTFINLQCRFHPRETIAALEMLPSHLLRWDDVIQICESNQTQDAVVWALDVRGEPQIALDRAAEYQRDLALQIVQSFKQPSDEPDVQLDPAIDALRAITQRGIDICLRRSRKSSDVDIPLEDIWFTLLNSQIKVVQLVSACQPSGTTEQDQEVETKCLTELRSLVQKTFGALVSITSTSAVSFPRLFKRLVNSTTSAAHSHYDEFRIILTGMLESYRSDGDMLTMTKSLVERDLYDTIASYTRQKSRGWTSDRGICIYCRNPLSKLSGSETPEVDLSFRIILSRAGKAYHSHCLPN